ncbi:unnamed protein product [Mytilus edulis]|uniref:Peptidase A2 domain-containing protein n=2 Tax=Mytilus edulis TaxID=6550 RepID=A0A8S3TDN0_MYTED|nr:unnamed protein product [Mytilus edulis]
MKCRCIDKECATISDAVQVIERYEAILGEPPVTEKKKTAVRQISTDDDQDYGFDQLNARVAKLEQTSYNTPTATSQTMYKSNAPSQGKFERKCFICESPRHIIKDCPMLKKVMSYATNQSRPYYGSNNTGKQQENYNPSKIGQLGKTCGKFDNGFYAVGEVGGLHVEFLVDTGSTTTLLACKMFDQILERNKPNLEPSRLNIKDVNGNTIIAYGQSIMNLNFNGKQFPQTIIVCDISPDAIIGQDFLLHYVNKIDYQRMVLQTSLTDIQCWVAGETQMVCRVEVKEETTIPANSRMFIPVDIPFCEKLSESCMIEPSVRLFDEKNIAILPAILQSSTENKVVSLHNFNDTDVKIYPKMKLGDCESYYEKNSTAVCCTEVSLDENPGESNLPEYLKELWERSCIHLNENESTDFANLLKRYKNVFSKSSDDIGRTNLIQHEINTGNAVPIRQPPRRLPFGKRQIEKDEIQRMLKLGVIEPSTSSWSSPVVLIAKKGGQGGTRFCVDFRGVNGLMTEKIAYPIPRIDDCLDALSTASFYGWWDVNTIRQQQLQDKIIGQLFIKFEDKETKPEWNSLSDESSDLKTLWNMWDRSSVHSTTGFTPNFLTFGREVTLPLQAIIPMPSPAQDYATCKEDFVIDLQNRLQTVHELARKNLKNKVQYQKKYYDVKSKKRMFKVGQLVWLNDPTRKIGVCSKLSAKWKGPYIITKCMDDTTYIVKKTAKQMAKAYHVNRLMSYEGQKLPVWMKKLQHIK